MTLDCLFCGVALRRWLGVGGASHKKFSTLPYRSYGSVRAAFHAHALQIISLLTAQIISHLRSADKHAAEKSDHAGKKAYPACWASVDERVACSPWSLPVLIVDRAGRYIS